MWSYDKKLEYPVKIKTPNPAMAKVIITQLGGPDGELGAATRYLSQRYSMPYDEVKAILTDVGTEGSRWTEDISKKEEISKSIVDFPNETCYYTA